MTRLTIIMNYLYLMFAGVQTVMFKKTVFYTIILLVRNKTGLRLTCMYPRKIKALRLDNTGAWVLEVYPSLLCNRMSENVDLYIKLKLGIFSFI